jgi:hypothetical protein
MRVIKLVSVFVKLKDHTLYWGCVTLNLEVSLLEIILKLEPSLISRNLLPKGKNISEIKVIIAGISLNRSEANFLVDLNPDLLLLNLFLRIAS